MFASTPSFGPIRRRLAALGIALIVAALLIVPALAATPAATPVRPAVAQAVPNQIVHQADIQGEACRDVRPQGAAAYLAVPGRGGRLDLRISQVLCHEGETLIVTVKGEAIGRIAIQPGGRGVAEFDTIHDDHFPRVRTGDRIALLTESGELVVGGIFR